MEKFNISNVLKGLGFVIPLLYIAFGCLLFTNLFFDFDRSKKMIFGIILILYGGFRGYRAYAKTRNNT
jgi:hypothetical protein